MKLYLYTAFHLNLAYSSIAEKDHPTVIEKCYKPLFDICEEMNVPFGIEASGYTLERIKKISPSLISKWKTLLKSGKCEFIGSGYAQIIGPLAPAKLNCHNLKIGNRIYQSILGVKPKIAYINEQTYSRGLIEHYIEVGYDAIIAEWNNSCRFHPEWNKEWQYHHQLALGREEKALPLIWNNFVAFQKFQRCIHGEIEISEYLIYLKSHLGEKTRFFPFYGNDVEIFDFRPGRYGTEAEKNKEGEWSRMKKLLKILIDDPNFEIILPSRVLILDDAKKGDSFNRIKLESPEQPIVVKKQEKYNLYRWALAGRDNLKINTKCYQIYKFLEKSKKENLKKWKELCYLWSSDFRTHITEDKWIEYLRRLGRFFENGLKTNVARMKKKQQAIKLPYDNGFFRCFEDGRYLVAEGDSIKCVFDKSKGMAISSFWFKKKFKNPLFGALPLGYYDDVSFAADFYTGHTIIERPGEHKITDLTACVPEVFIGDDCSLIIGNKIKNVGTLFKKEYRLNFKKGYFEIIGEIYRSKRELETIHIGHITFMPASFDKKTLFFATHNGGCEMDNFKIENKAIYHTQGLSALISAKHGLGATDGVVTVGDSKKKINIYHDQTISALIPSVHHHPMRNGLFYLRLLYSAQEIDETFKKSGKRQDLSFYLKIE